MKNTIKSYKFSIGLNDKNTKKQEIWVINAFKIATNLLIEYFWGWTINEWNWVYTHENGEIVIEKTLICSVVTNDIENVENFINECKKVFNQESILKEEIISKIDFC